MWAVSTQAICWAADRPQRGIKKRPVPEQGPAFFYGPGRRAIRPIIRAADTRGCAMVAILPPAPATRAIREGVACLEGLHRTRSACRCGSGHGRRSSGLSAFSGAAEGRAARAAARTAAPARERAGDLTGETSQITPPSASGLKALPLMLCLSRRGRKCYAKFRL